MKDERKALFFDVDGTLLDDRSGVYEVPDGVVREIRRIRGEGHAAFICSGRPAPFIDESLRSIGFDGYVLLNGANVEVAGETLLEERLSERMTRIAIEAHVRVGCDYAIDTAHHVYIDPSFEHQLHFLRGHRPAITTSFVLDEVLPHTLKIESCPDEAQRALVTAYLDEHLGTEARYDDNGTNYTLEVYSSRLSKASGIMRVLERIGIDRRNAYGFGDGINDLEMIRLCGCGVAMGNAVDELKAEADIVCGSVADKGLERVLRELF